VLDSLGTSAEERMFKSPVAMDWNLSYLVICRDGLAKLQWARLLIILISKAVDIISILTLTHAQSMFAKIILW